MYSIKYVFIALFFLIPSVSFGATVFETPSGTGQMTLLQTGNCCSGDDNYRPYSQIMLGVPRGVPFNSIRIYANSGDTDIPVNLYISGDNPPFVGSQTFGGDITLNTTSGDDNVMSTSTTAYKQSDNSYVADFQGDIQLQSGQYLTVLLNGAPYTATVFQLQTQKGFRLSVNQTPAGTYTFSKGTVVMQFCTGTCGQLGDWSELSYLEYSDDFKTKFLSGEITGSSTAVTFDIEYFLETSEFTIGNRPDMIHVSILRDTITNDSQADSFRSLILPLSNGTSTKSLTSSYNHPDGNYIATVMFWNIQNDMVTFAQTSVTLQYTIDGGTVSDYEIISVTNSQTNQSAVLEICESILDVGCGIRNAFRFLFIPSTESINVLTSSREEILEKKPFSYFQQTTDVITEYSTASTSGTFPDLSVTVLGTTVPIMSQATLDAIYDNETRLYIRQVIGYALWIFFSISIIYLVLNIFNRGMYHGENGSSDLPTNANSSYSRYGRGQKTF